MVLSEKNVIKFTWLEWLYITVDILQLDRAQESFSMKRRELTTILQEARSSWACCALRRHTHVVWSRLSLHAIDQCTRRSSLNRERTVRKRGAPWVCLSACDAVTTTTQRGTSLRLHCCHPNAFDEAEVEQWHSSVKRTNTKTPTKRNIDFYWFRENYNIFIANFNSFTRVSDV